MTAKKVTIIPEENKKIWGWMDQDGQFQEDLTRAQAEKFALEAKNEYPHDTIFIFKKVATVENKPFVKDL